MRLCVDIFEDTTVTDLHAALELLGNSRDAVLVLRNEDADETFLRAVRVVKIDGPHASHDEFHVDRSDGRFGGRYECDERLSLAELRGLLTAFLQGDPAWGRAHTWQRVGDDHKTVKA
jgi:hypothetical protein